MPSTKTASPKSKIAAPKSGAPKASASKATKDPAMSAAAPRKTAEAKTAAPVRLATDLTPAPVVVPNVTVLPVGADATAATKTGAEADQDANQSAALKKQEIVARVADLSGAKRKDVKVILEATLQVLGEALSKGEELNLPPLGKVKVNRAKAEGGTEILTLRLRRSDGGDNDRKARKEGLAQDGEDD
jgi:DNA-binding protein HU-alpha